MVIFCDGMIRAGSTWSVNVAIELLKSGYPNQRVFGFYSENPAVLAAAIRPRFSHLVIKSHALDPSAYALCRSGAIKTIYTWRHPYDVVISSLNMFGRSVEHWIGYLPNALRIWSFHQETNSACIVSYKALTTRPLATIAQIADYLGISIDPDRLSQIAETLSFERLKRFSQHIDEFRPPRLMRCDGYVFDRETLLHQDHIRNGGTGYGEKILTAEQMSAIDAVLRAEGFEFLCAHTALCASSCA
jgi:Sulfotransferase domain